MARAGVHARRDLALLRPALAALGLPVPRTFARALLLRHRAIDKNQEEEDQHLHFMRGSDDEDATKALAEAVGYAKVRARDAAERLADALRAPRDEGRVSALAKALADAMHVVRDSYSSGHATREPHGVGPVVALRAWESDNQPERGFGLVHALRHDLRFETPFAWFSHEVRASDAAVADLLALLREVAMSPPEARPAVFEERWRGFVARRFLPPHQPLPEKQEDRDRRLEKGKATA